LIVRYFPSEMGRLSGLFVGGTSVRMAASSDSGYRSGLGDYEALVLSEKVANRGGKLLDQLVVKLLRLYEGIFQPNQAITLLGKMGFGVSSGQATLSREIAEFMYPRPQWALIQELSETYGLDPYLILALMREESLFNVRALSRTGARGLMQIMPDTGRGIAKNLKVTWEGEDMLFDPETNVRFGVFYLNYLKQRFDGNVVYMLSGYNAGPNATHKWVVRDGGEPLDVFVSKIPYAETHHYVTRVLKSYWIYTLLYNPGSIPDIFRKG
jgi:soluble lytic murein transglycosylase-like protein